jgi:hypothetical protein
MITAAEAIAGGMGMIDAIFNGCVLLLLFLAEQLGVSYEAINVWIFVIIWPVITLALMATVVRQWMMIREVLKVKRELSEKAIRKDINESQTDPARPH